jgi:hypothetical protein
MTTLEAMGGTRAFNAAHTPRLTVTIHPPDKRRRDFSNTIAALKAHIDGISDALAVDDSKFRISWPDSFAEPVKGGKIIITITGE